MSQMETSMCIFPRKIQQRPRGGPAAAPQNVVITTLFCSGGPFSCKFLGAAPHTPFGNYNVILTGGGIKVAGDARRVRGRGIERKNPSSVVPLDVAQMGFPSRVPPSFAGP